MKLLRCAAHVLLIVGGLNWGLIALGSWMGSNWNVVNLLLGSWPMVEWLVYLLVGVSAVVVAVGCKKECMMHGMHGMGASGMGGSSMGNSGMGSPRM